MSHGGSTEAEVAEPNLTPLLDLVLQLVMFFMIVANFVTEQLNQSIQLPEASTAVPIDRERENLVILNVDDHGNLLEGGEGDSKIDSVPRMIQYFRDLHAIYKERKGDKVKEMTIVVRGHKDSTFEQIYRVMKAARDAGFVNVQLRANKPQANG